MLLRPEHMIYLKAFGMHHKSVGRGSASHVARNAKEREIHLSDRGSLCGLCTVVKLFVADTLTSPRHRIFSRGPAPLSSAAKGCRDPTPTPRPDGQSPTGPDGGPVGHDRARAESLTA